MAPDKPGLKEGETEFHAHFNQDDPINPLRVKGAPCQGLHQMIRYDGNNLRLDGVMHRPALSKAVLARGK